ncbi:MAG: VWA domain-containing protein, partial [Candidatus Sulfotelmatobacter sp.]
MLRKTFLSVCILASLFIGYGPGVESQETPDLHVVVNLVQLNVAVTDKNGNYITGLKPTDFVVTEDGITEKIATFAEGNEPALSLIDSADSKGSSDASHPSKDFSPPNSSPALSSLVAGANVFLLFDTSNYMYRGFVFAQDAIAEFVRSLGSADKIAFYSYSRDLSRAAALTSDR